MNYMDSVLYVAVTGDNVDVLRELDTKLTVGKQLTSTNSTVLHIACQYGSEECVTHILSGHQQALLLKINSRGETALHLAAKQGNFGVVKALIDSAKILAQQQHSTTPSSWTVLQDLIRTPDEDLETALHGAVRYNRKDIVELLVKEDPSYPHTQNNHKETPLYLASTRYYTPIITAILDHCYWPNMVGAGGTTDLHAMFRGPEGRTALHAAVLDYGGYECVKLLLNRNPALLKEVDDYGWTVFHYATYNNLDTIIELLVHGADRYVAYNKDNVYERTPLHLAAYKGNLAVIIKFVKYFPDSWEITDGSGRNIMHIAVEEDRKEVIDFILSRGFKASNNLLTKRDKNGNTPLHLITKLGCYVPRLMDSPADDSFGLPFPKITDLFWIADTAIPWFISKLKGEKVPEHWEVDWEVLDSNNYTPTDVLHLEQDTHTLADQVRVRNSLFKAGVKKHWCLWRTLKRPDMESGKRIVKLDEKTNNDQVEEYRKAINTHMVVSALIATIAFSALFNMPGGFDGSKGSPVLLRTSAFQVFMLSDTTALLCSVFSLLLYFITSFHKDGPLLKRIVRITAFFNFFAIVTMMIAFIAGTYAMLAHHSFLLALALCMMASLSFCRIVPSHIYILTTKKHISYMPLLLPASNV